MNPETVSAPDPAAIDADVSSDAPPDHIGQNIESVLAFYKREEEKISRPQRSLETISGFVGQPLYLVTILLFVLLWTLANTLAPHLGWTAIDPAPFVWLQAIVSLGALLTSTVVLIKQDRLAKLEEQRAHLDLQVNLLTEQKATKIINLLEELRRDLPMVKNRHDAEAAAFQEATDPHVVLAALDEQREVARTTKPTTTEERSRPDQNDTNLSSM